MGDTINETCGQVTAEACCALEGEEKLYEDQTFTCHRTDQTLVFDQAQKYSRLRKGESPVLLCFGVVLLILICCGFYKLYRQNKAIIMLLKKLPPNKEVSIKKLKKEQRDGKKAFFSEKNTVVYKTEKCGEENVAYGRDAPKEDLSQDGQKEDLSQDDQKEDLTQHALKEDLQPAITEDQEEKSEKQDLIGQA